MLIDGVSRALVEEANCGIYVEPENKIDFKNKILDYLNNPERVLIEGNNGYHYAIENFDRNRLSLNYLEIIKETLNKH